MSLITTEASPSLSLIENGGGSDKRTAELSRSNRRTVQNLSATSLMRNRSDLKLISRVRWEFMKRMLTNLQEVLLGTKLFLLFPAVPLAVVAHRYGCPRVSYSISLSLYHRKCFFKNTYIYIYIYMWSFLLVSKLLFQLNYQYVVALCKQNRRGCLRWACLDWYLWLNVLVFSQSKYLLLYKSLSLFFT